MNASANYPLTAAIPNPTQPDVEKIKRRLLKHGVFPTPKIIRTLQKKELQKLRRKAKKAATLTQAEPPLSDTQKRVLEEEALFETISREYRDFTQALKKDAEAYTDSQMMQKSWNTSEGIRLRQIESAGIESLGETLLIKKPYRGLDLGNLMDGRRDQLQWLLDDDIEVEQHWLENESRMLHNSKKRRRSVSDTIQYLLKRVSASKPGMKDHKFSRMMKQSGLRFTEDQLLKIVKELGLNGHWKHAMSIVEYVYNSPDHKNHNMRVVFTKLLTVLREARRPVEALLIFNLMRIYPDMAAYRNIAVTLGQAGFLRKLMGIIECMQQKPLKKLKNICGWSWDPRLLPDVVIFNAVLKACVSSRKWKGVFWVFLQMRKIHLKPNITTYQFAMDLMLHSGKYDLVHMFFEKMKSIGKGLKPLTFEVLVRTFSKEGRIVKAIGVVREMEERRIARATNVYQALVCSLCYNGMWQHAVVYVLRNPKKLPPDKHLKVAFSCMIKSALDGGHISDCVSVFECLRGYCDPNIATINSMLKIYGRLDMFSKARRLFEETIRINETSDIYLDGGHRIPDAYTYITMLEVCSTRLEWEYFEYVYYEMARFGYRLDQSRESLLMEASRRAGKVHLLEHAFDLILKGGEIPRWTLFAEMACEGISQSKFEKVTTLLKAMAYAPFQISQKQWIRLFLNNKDRIGSNGLSKLLDALKLSRLDESEEPTIVNLVRSLYSLCQSCSSIV